MRQLKKPEMGKRGCKFCTERTTEDGFSHCLHEECPYHELDEQSSYTEYLKKHGDFTVAQLLKVMN